MHLLNVLAGLCIACCCLTGLVSAGIDPYSQAAFVPIVRQANGIDHYAKLCVIGAGTAGSKAVETAQVLGKLSDWILIEKDNRIGGRLDTITIGTGVNSYEVEKHAQWLQGDLRNPILNLSVEMQPPLRGGNSLWEDYIYHDRNGMARGYNAGSSLGQALIKMYAAYDVVYHEIVPAILAGQLSDMSLRDCYSLAGWTPRTDEEYSAFAGLIDVEWGEIGDITSCANSGQWVAYSFYGPDAYNTPNFVTDPRGLSSVIEHLLKRKGIQLNDPRIHYNTRVTAVNTNTNVIRATRNGRQIAYQCEAVIETIPLGVRQQLLREDTNFYTPVPPMKVEATIHKYHHGFFRKIFLQYDTKFWPNVAHFTITPRDKGLQVVNWNNLDFDNGNANRRVTYYPGSKILLTTHNGPESNMYANMPDEELARRITKELEYVFGPAAAFEHLTPNGYKISSDPFNPNLYGSYSNRPATITDADFSEAFAPLGGHYFFSGEAACNYLNGYVVGAYHHGQAMAKLALVNLGINTTAQVGVYNDNDCFRPPPGWVA